MNQGLMKLVAFIFDHVVKQEWMKGHRMYFGGFSAILGGVVLVLDMTVGGHFSEEKAAMAWAGISLGYTVIGQAGKQERLIDAAKEKVS